MNRSAVLVLTATLLGTTPGVLAHHSWSADYDTRQTITVAGTVTEFVRRRPHSAFTMSVQQDNGEVAQWTVEYGRGFRDSAGTEYDADYFEPGEAITVTGQPHRDESANHVRLRSVVRDSDGASFETSRGRRNGRRR